MRMGYCSLHHLPDLQFGSTVVKKYSMIDCVWLSVSMSSASGQLFRISSVMHTLDLTSVFVRYSMLKLAVRRGLIPVTTFEPE